MSSIRKRKRGRKTVWVVDYYDATGLRRRKHAKTKEAAEALLVKALGESRQKIAAVADPTLTVAAFSEQWINAVRHDLKPRTVRSYKQVLRLYVLPAIGDMRIYDVLPSHVKEAITELAKKDLGKNTLRLSRACMSSMFGAAVEDEILIRNPAMQQGRRRKKRADSLAGGEKRRSIRPMDEDQFSAFCSEVPKILRMYQCPLLVMGKAGLRPGETWALHEGDIDLEKKKLQVRGALSDGKLSSTKTGDRRTVDISSELAESLREHLKFRSEEMLRLGVRTELIFFNESGGYLDESKARKRFRKACVAAKLPQGFRLYDLRHTYATLMLGAAVPLPYVAKQLGHADPATTLSWYAHWLPSMSEKYADVIDDPKVIWHRLGTTETPGGNRGSQTRVRLVDCES